MVIFVRNLILCEHLSWLVLHAYEPYRSGCGRRDTPTPVGIPTTGTIALAPFQVGGDVLGFYFFSRAYLVLPIANDWREENFLSDCCAGSSK